MKAAAVIGCGAVLLTALTGCNQTMVTHNVKPTARICDSSGCSERDPNVQTFVPGEDRRSPLLRDRDQYAGEDLAALRDAAAAGNASAANKLGQAHLYGLGGAPKNATRAAEYFRQAADAGHPWAQYRLARMHADGKGVRMEKRLSFELLMAAATQGHPLAAHDIGLQYLEGSGTVRKDPHEAARWFTVAAEGGVVDAQYNLALLKFRGQGEDPNLFEALQWMRRAGDGGHRQAQFAVGRLYMTGLDTMGQDLNEAESWLSRAAAQGDATAKKLLADVQKARREDEAFRRQLALTRAETERAWANAVFASWLTAPRVDYIVIW